MSAKKHRAKNHSVQGIHEDSSTVLTPQSRKRQLLEVPLTLTYSELITMALTNAETLKVATLARLALDDKKTAAYTTDLSNILSLVDTMQKIDTSDVAPLSNPLDATQRLRPDKVTATNQREAFLQNAPHSAAGLFLVPQVIE